MHVVGGVGRRKAAGWCSVLAVDSAFLVRILLVLFALETLLINSSVVSGTKSFYIHWNTTNSIFRIDNTDHIIDVNKDNSPFEYDQVNIICPVYQPGTHEEDAEKYIIYNVSKEEYDTCRITNPNPRIIAVCDKPNKLMYFTITFRSFTPQPGGLEFQPGQDYYFISTSSKDDLHRRIGGRCSSDNMKVVFKVCCRQDEAPNSTSSSSSSISPVSRTPAITSSTTISTTIMYSPPQLPTRPTRPPPAKELPPLKPKKTNEYDKHPNEVLKNEELTYNTNGGSSSWRCSIPLVVALAWTQLALLLAPRRR